MAQSYVIVPRSYVEAAYRWINISRAFNDTGADLLNMNDVIYNADQEVPMDGKSLCLLDLEFNRASGRIMDSIGKHALVDLNKLLVASARARADYLGFMKTDFPVARV